MFSISVDVAPNIAVTAAPTHLDLKKGQKGLVQLTAADVGTTPPTPVPVPPFSLHFDPSIATVVPLDADTLEVTAVGVGHTDITG